MAEIIDLAEIQAQRRKHRARAPRREHLERAVRILKENLAATATMLVDAPHADQDELLSRVERLSAMIRYGIGMLGESAEPAPDPSEAEDTL
jgi:hypothetical protein